MIACEKEKKTSSAKHKSGRKLKLSEGNSYKVELRRLKLLLNLIMIISLFVKKIYTKIYILYKTVNYKTTFKSKINEYLSKSLLSEKNVSNCLEWCLDIGSGLLSSGKNDFL